MATLPVSENNEDVPIQEEALEKKFKLFAEKDNKIDMKLITKTSVKSTTIATLSEEEKIEVLLGLKVIHLDWLNIKTIENLDVFTHLESLYLQYNQIERIDNLDMLINLEYLALNNNRIKRIENLNHMKKLLFLNLADNQIEDFDQNELPSGISILKLQGNACVNNENYLNKIFSRLPELSELDSETVTPVLRMVGLGKLPRSMLDYAKQIGEIEKGNEKEEEKEDEENEDEIFSEEEDLEEEDGIEEDAEGEDEEEGDDEDEEEEVEENKEDRGRETTEALSRTRISELFERERSGTSDASTNHSRIDESSWLEPGMAESDLKMLRDKTEKLLKKMKEKHNRQLGDTMRDIQDNRKLQEELIKIYKSKGAKK